MNTTQSENPAIHPPSTRNPPTIRPTPPCSVLRLGFLPPTIQTHKKPRRKHRTPTHNPPSTRNPPAIHPQSTRNPPAIHPQSTHNPPAIHTQSSLLGLAASADSPSQPAIHPQSARLLPARCFALAFCLPQFKPTKSQGENTEHQPTTRNPPAIHPQSTLHSTARTNDT